MNQGVLEEYIDRPITIHFQDSRISPSPEMEGVLQNITAYGILLQDEEDTLLFIPYHSIRMFEIKPKPSFWQKLTGTY
ncbi:hypothetical protein [Brevibacillus sp. SYSU BS000544]|uniref:hypothetical protein n=1 Tax=Brevibacillus sp. SYSU BS000544 TaxID=3416443 RepID=UPI003CE5BD75